MSSTERSLKLIVEILWAQKDHQIRKNCNSIRPSTHI